MVFVHAIELELQSGEEVGDHDPQNMVQDPGPEASARGDASSATHHCVYAFCLRNIILYYYLGY